MDEASTEGSLTAEAVAEERRLALEAVADEEVVAAQEEEDEAGEDEDDDEDDVDEDEEDDDDDDEDDEDEDEDEDDEEDDDAVGTDERGREILRARGLNSARVPATDAEPEGSLDEVDTSLLKIQRIEPAVGAAQVV